MFDRLWDGVENFLATVYAGFGNGIQSFCYQPADGHEFLLYSFFCLGKHSIRWPLSSFLSL